MRLHRGGPAADHVRYECRRRTGDRCDPRAQLPGHPVGLPWAAVPERRALRPVRPVCGVPGSRRRRRPCRSGR